MKEKRDIHALIVKEVPSLNNLLDAEDVSKFRELTSELRDTWTKKQVFRTETEMRISVLQDAKYPTKASKYWQCVREQNVFLEERFLERGGIYEWGDGRTSLPLASREDNRA